MAEDPEERVTAEARMCSRCGTGEDVHLVGTRSAASGAGVNLYGCLKCGVFVEDELAYLKWAQETRAIRRAEYESLG
ncbi:hypothetical protein [Streptomyces sp. TRM49041]|uniref:hypothetical protein n=1 Tax=Streptomyces sp. TRM49041 TaxID=2603216 RepID=UPI0011EC1D16|nr:hypothetical protein [Streptomyces sp. TRM49041]